MFNCRACESYRHQLTVLQAQLSDLTELHLGSSKAWTEERQKLLDRILALANAPALREITRTERPEREVGPPPRPNFPGFKPDHRPPVLGQVAQGFIHKAE